MWIWTSWLLSDLVRLANVWIKRKLPRHGQGGRPAPPILASGSTIRDVASQQRILELEAELAKMKSDTGTSPSTAPEGSTPATTPIGRALQGQPAASTSFDPSSLLISPGSVNTWLVDNQPSSLTETQYKKWLKDLKLPQHKQDTLEKQLEKVNEWWQNQPDDASKTIQRASVAMGIDPCKHKGATTDWHLSSRSWRWRYWCTPD